MKAYTYPYQDPNLGPEQRADDLLSRMSLEEKMAQVQCFSAVHCFGRDVAELFPNGAGQVSCLLASIFPNKEAVAEMVRRDQEKLMDLSEHNIPAIFHIETLTGVLIADAATFPSGIGQAATWDPDTQKKMGRVIGKQARAAGFRQGLAPVLDICRDPRFGRLGETYGEDPTLASAMGTAYVQGLQNDGDLADGIIATGKHFLGFQAGEAGIHTARTAIPPRELREVYAKPFQAAITEGKLESVMNSYATIDREPVVGSRSILTGLLREEMGFGGITVSDYTSIGQLHTVHRVSRSMEDAGYRALEAGMDMELPIKESYSDELLQRFRDGTADIEILNRAVRRILIAKFRLGLFEDPYPANPEELAAAFDDICAQEISLEMALKSMTLIKNNGVLPIDPRGKKVAVIGHHAASARMMFGGYSFMAMKENSLGIRMTMAGIEVANDAPMKSSRGDYPGSIVNLEHPGVEPLVKEVYPGIKSLLEELRDTCPNAEFVYAYGYPYAGDDESGFEEALAIAKDADLVILTLGGRYGWNTSSTSGEGIDSMSINLPPCQERFIEKLAKLNKPTVAVHFDGRPISSDAADNYIDAILEAWSPGVHGAKAITEVLLGRYNPAGRLPVTVARNSGQIPVYYYHENGSGTHTGPSIAFNSYVDGPREPRYCFGHGLSYTSFEYSGIKLSKSELDATGSLTVSVEITNTGNLDGEEVVQLYARDLYSSMSRPVMELVGFRRVAIAAGEKKKVSFTFPMSQFAFLDRQMKWKVEAGDMEVLVGASSDDIRLKAQFRITNDAYVDGANRGFFAKTEVTPAK